MAQYNNCLLEEKKPQWSFWHLFFSTNKEVCGSEQLFAIYHSTPKVNSLNPSHFIISWLRPLETPKGIGELMFLPQMCFLQTLSWRSICMRHEKQLPLKDTACYWYIDICAAMGSKMNVSCLRSQVRALNTARRKPRNVSQANVWTACEIQTVSIQPSDRLKDPLVEFLYQPMSHACPDHVGRIWKWQGDSQVIPARCGLVLTWIELSINDGHNGSFFASRKKCILEAVSILSHVDID